MCMAGMLQKLSFMNGWTAEFVENLCSSDVVTMPGAGWNFLSNSPCTEPYAQHVVCCLQVLVAPPLPRLPTCSGCEAGSCLQRLTSSSQCAHAAPA
jgi:hypothetical protein